jgi:hypothetical protein
VPLAGDAAATARREEPHALKRLGLAGIGSMQVMMYAAGLYTGAFQGIEPRIAEFLKLACLLIATPVLFYSGAPILRGALHDLRRRTLGMDVTVSLALLLAYAASAFNTLRGAGEVYFDSVTMFIFFLLLGRWFEMKGRHQAARRHRRAGARPARDGAAPRRRRRRAEGAAGRGARRRPAARRQRPGDPVDGRVCRRGRGRRRGAGHRRVDPAAARRGRAAARRLHQRRRHARARGHGGAARIDAARLVRLLEHSQASGPASGSRPSAWPRGSSCACCC